MVLEDKVYLHEDMQRELSEKEGWSLSRVVFHEVIHCMYKIYSFSQGKSTVCTNFTAFLKVSTMLFAKFSIHVLMLFVCVPPELNYCYTAPLCQRILSVDLISLSMSCLMQVLLSLLCSKRNKCSYLILMEPLILAYLASLFVSM